MKFDIEQAFTYYFKDSDLAKKIAILYGLMILYTLCGVLILLGAHSMIIGFLLKNEILLLILSILLFIFLIFSMLFFTGYYYSNINKRIYKSDNNLVEIINNQRNILFIGLKYVSASMVLKLIIQLFLFIVIVLFAILFIIGTKHTMTPENLGNTLASFSKQNFYFILSLLIFLIITACEISFATDLRFKSYFDFKKIKHILINNFGSFIKLIAWQFVLGIAFFILFMIACITIIGILALPFLIIDFWLTCCELKAQFIKYAFKIKNNSTENTNDKYNDAIQQN